MTSASFSSGTDDHPEVAEISALTEGLLPPERSAELRAHLASCALCADVHTSLEDIRTSLGTLPGPVRMPADVAGRIDAALAAEALLDATAPATADAESSPETARSVSRETEHRAAPVSRETDGASGRSADRPPSRPAGHSRGATGPGSGPGRGNGSGTRRPRRWRTALLASAGAVAVLGLGGALLQGLSAGGNDDAAGTSVAQDSGAAEQQDGEGALKQQVRALLAKSSATPPEGTTEETGDAPSVGTKQSPGNPESPGQPASPGSPEADAPMRGGASTVPSCVRESIHSGDQPLAVDASTTYRGKETYLVVLPHPGDETLVDAYVVDAACTTGAAPGPGELLAKRTYARR